MKKASLKSSFFYLLLFWNVLVIALMAQTAFAVDSTAVQPVAVSPSSLPPREFTLGTGQLNSSRSQEDSRFDFNATSGDTRYQFVQMTGLPTNIPGWGPGSEYYPYHCPFNYSAYIVPALVDSQSGGDSSQNLSGAIDFCTTSWKGSLVYVAYGHVVNLVHGSASNVRAYLNFTVTCIQCPATGCAIQTPNNCTKANNNVLDFIVQPPHT